MPLHCTAPRLPAKTRSAPAPFASPRVAQLSFAGDGVDRGRGTGHIEVESKLWALRLEQTQLQPPCSRKAFECLVQGGPRPKFESGCPSALVLGLGRLLQNLFADVRV